LTFPRVMRRIVDFLIPFVARTVRKAGSLTPSGEVPRRLRAVKSHEAHAREARDCDAAIAAAWASGACTQPQFGAHFGLHYSSLSRITRAVNAGNKT
jgi:putative transposase